MELLGPVLAAGATILVALLGLFQWWLSERRRSQRRDDLMMHWGAEVIDLMSEIDGYCEFGKLETANANPLISAAVRASALVDRGRLFFPNVESQDRDDDAEGSRPNRGFRVAILDEVVKAYLLAKYLYNSRTLPDSRSKNLIRLSRRNFVAHLQKELGKSLKKSSAEKTGQSVSPDPMRW